ncbi:hypothetical protein PR048_027320 [Dryococelus australis]|uniref:BTB domain-containing protein n=1 Tax=Dryococelus australis TaxID=614101 RepID=A0ABQ9GGC2_9NEOP|nr:hypothetical protein PR048_027320 [Dryococelus australis]
MMQAQSKSTKGRSTVASRLQKLLDEKKWTDIKFLVGVQPNVEIVEAHRVVIAAANPVFEAMSFGGLAEGKGLVKVPDVSPAAFKVMLQHMYTDVAKFKTVEVACDVLQVARKYLLTQLTDDCSSYLNSHLSPA